MPPPSLLRQPKVGPLAGRLSPAVVLVLTSVALGAATTSALFVRVALALAVTLMIAAVALSAPRHTVLGLVIWLVVLGSIRRILLAAGALGDNDPLLLVGPAVVAVLMVVAVRRGAFRRRSHLTNAVLVLTGLLLLGTLNPAQGGIAVGVGGLLFVLVPMAWFWIGRAVVDDRLLRRILGFITVLAPLAALYGLYQVYRGFPPWDAEWIESRGYAALKVGDAVRQFASFSAASEYVIFLAVGTVVCALQLRRLGRLVPAASALGLMAWALALSAVRGVVLGLVVTLGVLFAASRGYDLARTTVLGVVALFVLTVGVSAVDPSNVGGDQTSALLSRQVTGLSDPFSTDPTISTLPGHIDSLVNGIAEAFRGPIGQGTGIVSIAADRFGSTSQNSETDPSNVALAIGVPGLLAYAAVAAGGLRLAFGRARRQQDFLSLAALGILLVTALQWLNGANYSVAPLPWLVLGWLDRPADLAARADDQS